LQQEPYGVTPPVWEDSVALENLTPHATVFEAEETATLPEAAPAAVVPVHESAAPAAEAVAEATSVTPDPVHTSPADEPFAAPVEFEPQEASASYRIDPSAPSEFRFASSSSSLAEEELAPEAEAAELEDPLDLRPEASMNETAAFSAASTGVADLDADFEDLDEDLEATGPETGLVEEEEVTEEEEYDFTPLYVDSEEHDLQELEEETLDHEVSAGGEIGEMVRDAHLDQRIAGVAGGLTIEDEAEEDELEDAHVQGVEES
jgi:ribonuclease G